MEKRLSTCLLLFAMTVGLTPSALAQPRNDGNVNYQGLLAKRPPKPQAPDVPPPSIAWPRLERGTVLCRSEADLLRRAAALRGEPEGPADCRVILGPTPIQILGRFGPGRTQVQISEGTKETGWTDAWLPPTPPRGTIPVRAQ